MRKQNQVNNRVKYDKRKYYRKLLESNASEPRKFWKTIKEVFPMNCLTKHTTSSLKTDEVETLNDLDTANIFCSFFSEIANNLKSAAFPSQVLNHLEDNKLLSDAQFGYRLHKSTELAATLFLDDIRKNMDKGELTGAIFIDLRKAFDTLSHSLIISKLPEYGIIGVERE